MIVDSLWMQKRNAIVDDYPDRYMELLAQICNSVTEPFGHVVQANDY